MLDVFNAIRTVFNAILSVFVVILLLAVVSPVFNELINVVFCSIVDDKFTTLFCVIKKSLNKA